MEKTDILSLRYEELEAKILELGEKKYRAKQIFHALHRRKVRDFSEITELSAQLRDKLETIFYIQSLKIDKMLVSKIDNTVKYLYRLKDGNCVEGVLMSYKHGDSLCISTQVGCKMGCAFCASTIAGFARNLTPSEMLLQLYEAEKASGRTVSSMVLMGIGEPLDNYENLLSFLDILTHKDGHNMSLRHVSVSTCGLVDKIRELAPKRYGLSLSISLHAVDNERRSELMPIAKRYNIDELMDACRYYFDQTGRRIYFEYAAIAGVNDTQEDAMRLAQLLKGLICHVNIIPINEVTERSFKPSPHAYEFAKKLRELGLTATVRRTLGADINAACGQLRRESIEQKEGGGSAWT